MDGQEQGFETPPRPSDDPVNGSAPVDPPTGEYATGRVICEFCGAGISFRDEATGGFTLKHWDAHRASCVASVQPAPDSATPAILLPPTHPSSASPLTATSALLSPTVTASPGAPSKRRRAKRTEEERISYLRTDPYVAQFEAYRVLCANCSKWIRLRPNSTYCSIPWDAHRKSCLARKGLGGLKASSSALGPDGIAPADPRSTIFSRDPEVRKFDGERVLCNMCAVWVSLNPDTEEGEAGGAEDADNDFGVKRWLRHRAACEEEQRNRPSTSRASGGPVSPVARNNGLVPALSQPVSSTTADLIDPRLSGEGPPSTSSTISEPITPPSSFDQLPLNTPIATEAPSSPVNSNTKTPTRRLNAEQRAAFLRADPLIGQVEANRVYCTLCEKWVQLRQDSSYCAYPWVMHRGKCLRRAQRRAQKAAEMAEMKARQEELQRQRNEQKGTVATAGHLEPEIVEPEMEVEDPESEEGVESEEEALRERRREKKKKVMLEKKAAKKRGRGRPRKEERSVRGTDGSGESGRDEEADVEMDELEDGDGTEVDVKRVRQKKRRRVVSDESDADMEDGHGSSVNASPMHARVPRGLAELKTPNGRRDQLTIPTLVSFLNISMPPRKHSHYDREEVTAALEGLWSVNGDVIGRAGITS
ncbi:hypothetical protein JAAARDRAFT_47872 [Jaapia argillacea MUCL 33604]|uniref:Uncharacterized protein n=1 Tax=Jaapia argillacea MUCL 33604 TaxID=933084 RepID=A0A067Q1A5_9AGAM|nr:hypothetical protein JAAARDRAFT_47872 [Jaapia argillacea MUCL 33604]